MSDRVVLDGDLSLSNPLDGDALLNVQMDGQGGVYSRYDWRGYSAYEIAVQHGYTGTEEEWLSSLHGADGATGPQGETGATGQQGPKGDKGDPGDDYILTEQDKQEIAGLVDTPVDDVQINGTSIVTDGVANVPLAGSSVPGVIKVNYGGLNITNDGTIRTAPASTSEVKAGTASYVPITPSHVFEAAFYGFAKAAGHNEKNSTLPVGQYTEEAKRAIREMLGLPRYTEVEVIADITTDEDLESVVIDTDTNGQPFSLRKAKILCMLTASTTGAATYIASHYEAIGVDGVSRDLAFPTLTMTSATKSFQVYEFDSEGGLYFTRAWRSNGAGNSTSTIYTIAQYNTAIELHSFRLSQYNSSLSLIPKGTRIYIQGIRA